MLLPGSYDSMRIGDGGGAVTVAASITPDDLHHLLSMAENLSCAPGGRGPEAAKRLTRGGELAANQRPETSLDGQKFVEWM